MSEWDLFLRTHKFEYKSDSRLKGLKVSSVLNTLQPHWPYSLSALTLFQRLLTPLSAQFLGIQILLDVLLLPQSSLLPPQPSRSRFPKPYSVTCTSRS